MRHPLPLLTNEVMPISMRLDNTCLLLQDVHVPFTDSENGWIAREATKKVVQREFDEYFAKVDTVISNCHSLLKQARQLNLLTVFTCFGYTPPALPSPLQRAMGWVWNLTEDSGDFPTVIQPLASEAIFPKPGWSSLSSSAFQTYVAEQEISNFILVGSLLDFGIQHTSYALADAGLSTLIISDAVSSLTDASDAPTRGNLGHGMTKFRTTAETILLLERLKDEKTVLI